MKINEFHTKVLEYNQWMKEDNVEEVTAPLQIGSKIRTKKMSMEGEVVRIGKTSYGTDEVIFKTADGRTMKTPISNVVPIQKLQDGDGGGIGFNRAADQHVVSYEKVLDEIMKRWEEETTPPPANDEHAEVAKYIRGRDRVDQSLVDEVLKQIAQSNLNIYNIMNEPQDAAQKAAARVLTRMYDQISDEHNIGGDDFEKISSIIVQQLQQKFGIHEELDYVLERWNKFNEADDDAIELAKMVQQHRAEDEAKAKEKMPDIIKVPSTNKNFEIWYSRQTNKLRPVRWQVRDARKKEIKHEGSTAPSENEAYQAAEDWIAQSAGSSTASKNITLDFNKAFAKAFAPDGHDFYYAIWEGPKLILSDEPEKGLRKSSIRTQAHQRTAGATLLPGGTVSSKEANAAGLKKHSRYTLGPREDLGGGVYAFPLQWESSVESRTDLKPLREPALTTAHERD